MESPASTDLRIWDTLESTLEAEGLTFLGVASVPEVPGASELEAEVRNRQELERGSQGTMTWLVRHAPLKYQPALAVPGTKSLVIAGMNYFQPRPPTSQSGLIARYAWGKDYHKVLLKALQRAAERLQGFWPEAKFQGFTDTAPIDERYWAQKASASFTARNALAINSRLGSWFVLGEIFSSQEFPESPSRRHAHGACPSSCRRCVEACPTNALDGSGRLEARRCISYLTIEHKGSVPEELRAKTGSWVFGCDLCQEVCPFNLKASTTTQPEFLAWKAGSHADISDLLAIPDQETFTRRFGGSPVHRAGFQGLRRNACLVAGNLGLVETRRALERLVGDKDEVVAEAAGWALSQLAAKESSR